MNATLVMEYTRDAEEARTLPPPRPEEDLPLADAEDEEFAELWAADRGNQGA